MKRRPSSAVALADKDCSLPILNGVRAVRRRYSIKQPPRAADLALLRRRKRESFPLPLEPDLSQPWRRVLYLARGPPGSGKSTAVRKLLSMHLAAQGVHWNYDDEGAAFSPVCRAFILSTDDYYTPVDDAGVSSWVFDPKLISENHTKNQERCEVAMELGRTPLFVDNTNVCLWEMRAYVEKAERYGYAVRLFDPRKLGHGSMDPDTLVGRLCGERAREDRASGKHIPQHVIERMVRNFEHLPCGAILPDGSVMPDALALVLEAKSPFDRPKGPPKPLYAALDAEARTLACVGTVDLGPAFWGEQVDDGAPLHSNLFDARCSEGLWRLPPRLHVTVRFFGRRPRSEDLAFAEELVGSWHEVELSALVFVRGGDILCAACSVTGDESDALRELTPDDWTPHVTLLTREPWRAPDSTALLRAWQAAAASAAPQVTSAGDSASRDAVEATFTEGGRAQSAEASETQDIKFKEQDEKPTEQTQSDDATQATQLEASLTQATQIDQGSQEDAPPSADSQERGQAASTATATPCESGVGGLQVYPNVQVLGKTVDICVLPLSPPRSLGRCCFQLFY
eukprot:TRINITY_DN18842_c1_g2_i1.p1 TRINITY_DN18842_c1_g2~~TRINITY_DN18842_c1_g2_i1.p1  ORF type:complete len:579 (+),score=103.45 TRINITY_DN18842_c1_g2_i1:28-1737(+)